MAVFAFGVIVILQVRIQLVSTYVVVCVNQYWAVMHAFFVVKNELGRPKNNDLRGISVLRLLDLGG